MYERLFPERTGELDWTSVALAITLRSRAAGARGEHDLAARVVALLAAQEPTGSEERTVAALVMAGTDPGHARDLLRSAPPDPDRGEGRPLPLEHAFGFVAAGAPEDIEPGRYVSEADRTDRADEFRGLLAAALVGFAPHALANALIARPWFLGHDLSMAAPTYLAQARAAQLAPRGAAADALARRLVDDLLSGEHWHHALPALTVLAPDAVRRTRDAVRTYVGHLG